MTIPTFYPDSQKTLDILLALPKELVEQLKRTTRELTQLADAHAMRGQWEN